MLRLGDVAREVYATGVEQVFEHCGLFFSMLHPSRKMSSFLVTAFMFECGLDRSSVLPVPFSKFRC